LPFTLESAPGATGPARKRRHPPSVGATVTPAGDTDIRTALICLEPADAKKSLSGEATWLSTAR